MYKIQTLLCQSLNKFALKLYHELPKTGNLFFSPLSIGLLFAALIPGAKGTVRRELAELLGLNLSESELIQQVSKLLTSLFHGRLRDHHFWLPDDKKHDHLMIELANALLVRHDYSIKEKYRKMLINIFLADIFSFDINRSAEVVKTINQWVEGKTKGLIPRLLGLEDIAMEEIEEIALFWINAVYFKGEWLEPFTREFTRKAPFHLLNEGSIKTHASKSTSKSADKVNSVDVQMMRKTLDLKYYQNNSKNHEAVSLPYKARVSMIIMLPRMNKYEEFSNSLLSDYLTEFLEKAAIERIQLELPQFSLKSRFTLVSELEKLGLKETMQFTPGGFSGITDDPRGLRISKLIHQAQMKVDEEGTIALALSIEMGPTSGVGGERPQPIKFIVNRPFIFFIFDEVTGTILFMGRVLDPSQIVKHSLL